MEGALRNIILSVIVSTLMLSGSAAYSGEPVVNVSPKSHPKLDAAQRLCRVAYQKIVAAQKANEWDVKGHAQKAKELLDQVNQELKLAAEAANRNKGK